MAIILQMKKEHTEKSNVSMSHLKVVKCQGTSEKGKEERRM
jgi:hypothetical protein